MKKYCLSVDWDYFTPSASRFWAWVGEHKDSYVNDWVKRDTNGLTVEEYSEFWKWLSKWFIVPKGMEILVSESHIAMYNLLGPNHRVILFDSHHDCYNNSYLDCGSWGTNWLEKNADAKITWFSQISDSDLSCLKHTIKHSVKNRVSIINKEQTVKTLNDIYLSKGKRSSFDFVHVCRSASWAPPKFDKDFLKFLESSGHVIKHLPDFTGVNPLSDRMECFVNV